MRNDLERYVIEVNGIAKAESNFCEGAEGQLGSLDKSFRSAASNCATLATRPRTNLHRCRQRSASWSPSPAAVTDSARTASSRSASAFDAFDLMNKQNRLRTEFVVRILGDLPTLKSLLFGWHRLKRTEVSVSYKKPRPGKIGAKLWAIFDPAEDNNMSQREPTTFRARNAK